MITYMFLFKIVLNVGVDFRKILHALQTQVSSSHFWKGLTLFRPGFAQFGKTNTRK